MGYELTPIDLEALKRAFDEKDRTILNDKIFGKLLEEYEKLEEVRAFPVYCAHIQRFTYYRKNEDLTGYMCFFAIPMKKDFLSAQELKKIREIISSYARSYGSLYNENISPSFSYNYFYGTDAYNMEGEYIDPFHRHKNIKDTCQEISEVSEGTIFIKWNCGDLKMANVSGVIVGRKDEQMRLSFCFVENDHIKDTPVYRTLSDYMAEVFI